MGGWEARAVLVKLQESTRVMLGDSDAHEMLVSWGDLIRARFKACNLPITSRLLHYPDMRPVVDVLSDLS